MLKATVTRMMRRNGNEKEEDDEEKDDWSLFSILNLFSI